MRGLKTTPSTEDKIIKEIIVSHLETGHVRKKQLDEIGLNVNILTNEQLDNVMTMLIMVFVRL